VINRLIGALAADDNDTVVAAEAELSKQLSETAIR
jgi:hypothetical protein